MKRRKPTGGSPLRFALSRARRGLALLLAAAGACGEGTDPPNSVRGIIAQVIPADSDATVILVDSALPGYSGAPDQLFVLLDAPVWGGAAAAAIVNSADTLRRLFIGVSGMPDHYVVHYSGLISTPQLTFARTDATVSLVPAPGIDSDTIPLLFLASAGGTVHGQGTALLRVVRIDPGDIVIEAAWSVDADIDLRVVEPTGEEVFRGNTPSSSGGTLDRDANPLCTRPGERSERITWPSSPPPAQRFVEYVVRLNYSHACGQTSTPWTVTVKIRGQPDQTFSGTFVGVGDAAGTGVDVVSFAFPP